MRQRIHPKKKQKEKAAGAAEHGCDGWETEHMEYFQHAGLSWPPSIEENRYLAAARIINTNAFAFMFVLVKRGHRRFSYIDDFMLKRAVQHRIAGSEMKI